MKIIKYLKNKTLLAILACFCLWGAAYAEIKEIKNLDQVYYGKHNVTGKTKTHANQIKSLDVLEIKNNAARDRIPRKSGEIYKKLTTLFFDEADKFGSGYGRLALFGKSKEETCEADLFFNKASASVYLAVFIDKNKWIDELYLDHPSMKYSDVLFQYLLTESDRPKKASKTALVIDGRKSSFKMISNSKQVDMVFYKEEQTLVHCTFDLALVEYFNGEQE